MMELHWEPLMVVNSVASLAVNLAGSSVEWKVGRKACQLVVMKVEKMVEKWDFEWVDEMGD
jgi:hypothetical protein